mgnify:CR=1 FL=1
MEKELDRQDVVRDLITKKLPTLAEEFYMKETKRQKKDRRFRMKFDDLLGMLKDRARSFWGFPLELP